MRRWRRDERDAVTSPGTSRMAGNHQKLEEATKDPPGNFWGRCSPAGTWLKPPNLWLCYDSPQDTHWGHSSLGVSVCLMVAVERNVQMLTTEEGPPQRL